MTELTQKQKNKLLAAAEIVQEGEMAVLKNLLEMRDTLDDFKAEWEAMKAQLGEDLPTELQTKFDTLSTDCKGMCEECDRMCKQMEEDMSADKEEMTKMRSEMSKEMTSKMEAMKTSLLGTINEVKGLIPEMPDAFDPTDILKRINEIEAKIPQIPDELKAEQVRDKLESLEGDERLDKSAIKGLDEELKRIEKVAATPRGGGTSAAGVAFAFKHIGHTEQPVGDIDGVNTTYYVKNTIWWIAGFTLNGEQIAQLPNFTYSGRTITFSSALPAIYSGKDFEVKYIGT